MAKWNKKGLTPEEREKRKEVLRQQVEGIINNFENSPESIVEYLEFNSKFHQYSTNNTILIYEQNQFARFCASYKSFQDMGYQVQKGQTGMKIFVPYITTVFHDPESNRWIKLSEGTKEQKALVKAGQLKSKQYTSFGIGTVFDIGQTDCPPEDYPKLFDMGFASETHNRLYQALVHYAESQNISVQEKFLPTITARGYYQRLNNSITLSDKLNDSMKLSVMAHELSHAIMHNNDEAASLPQMQKEIEADSLSLMLRQHLGISDIEDIRRDHLKSAYKSYIKMMNENAGDNEYPDLSKILDNVNKAYISIIEDFDKSINNYLELHPETEKNFSQTIDDFLNGKINPYAQIFICKTTNAMIACGAKDLDVIINQSTLRKVMSDDAVKYKHPHNLGKEIIKSIPGELNDPVMILHGSEQNSIVLVSDLTDENNQNIIISCRLNSEKSIYEVNEITSIYPKNNISNYINTQLNKHNLIGCNKKRANRLLKSLELQSSEVEASIDYTNIISGIDKNVNSNSLTKEENTMANAEKEKYNSYFTNKGEFEQEGFDKLTENKDVRYDFIRTTFRDIHFTDKDIIGQMSECRFWNCTFNHFDGMEIESNKSVFHNCTFESSDFSNAHFMSAQFYHCKFNNTNLKNSNIEFAKIGHTTFDKNTELSNVHFYGTSMNSNYIHNCIINEPVQGLSRNNITMGGATHQEIEIHRSQIFDALKTELISFEQIAEQTRETLEPLSVTEQNRTKANGKQIQFKILPADPITDYRYNVQVHFKHNFTDEFIYSGIGRFCNNLDEIDKYISKIEAEYSELGYAFSYEGRDEVVQNQHYDMLKKIAEYEQEINVSSEERIVEMNYSTAHWQAKEDISPEQAEAVYNYIEDPQRIGFNRSNEIRRGVGHSPLTADEYYNNIKNMAYVKRFTFGDENSVDIEAINKALEEVPTEYVLSKMTPEQLDLYADYYEASIDFAGTAAVNLSAAEQNLYNDIISIRKNTASLERKPDFEKNGYKLIAEKHNFYLINKDNYYAFGHRDMLINNINFIPVNQQGNINQVKNELLRWKNEVDFNNPQMREVEEFFISSLENIEKNKFLAPSELDVKFNGDYWSIVDKSTQKALELPLGDTTSEVLHIVAQEHPEYREFINNNFDKLIDDIARAEQAISDEAIMVEHDRLSEAISQGGFGEDMADSAAYQNLQHLENLMSASDNVLENTVEPESITLVEYLGRQGLSSPVDDFMIDKLKLPHGQSKYDERKMHQNARKSSQEYHDKRNAAIQEYQEKVAAGEIIEPTNVERYIKAAQGHPDNASTQAAQRVLAKRGYIQDNNGDWVLKEPEINQIENVTELPEGWKWIDNKDLSGHLQAPDGTEYFSYDWTTYEYKIYETDKYDMFFNDDTHTPGTLSEFKEYATKFVNNIIVKNIKADTELKVTINNQLEQADELPVDVLCNDGKIEWYSFASGINDTEKVKELLQNIQKTEKQVVSISGDKNINEIVCLNDDLQFSLYNYDVYPDADAALKAVLANDNIAKLVPYEDMLQASTAQDLTILSNSSNSKYPYIKINHSDNPVLVQEGYWSFEKVDKLFQEINNQNLDEGQKEKANVSLFLDSQNTYNFDVKFGIESGGIPKHLNRLINEGDISSDKSLQHLQKYLKENGLIDEHQLPSEQATQMDLFNFPEIL